MPPCNRGAFFCCCSLLLSRCSWIFVFFGARCFCVWRWPMEGSTAAVVLLLDCGHSSKMNGDGANATREISRLW